MKKIIVLLFVLTIVVINNSKNEVVIPEMSIRYRIIASSNELQDQMLKYDIKNQINEQIMTDLISATNIDESRKIINNNIEKVESVVKQYTDDYSISFGNNYFPEKTYKGITYKEGDYESLVITLGEGLGDNWWCVLYPPLCLVEEDNYKYPSLVKEILNKYI